MLTCFFDNFNRSKQYSRSQLQNIIESKKNVLCYYAKETGKERCALALNFDEYNPKDDTVPLHVLFDKEVWAISLTQGKGLLETYNKSRIGKNVIVIYTYPKYNGWFSMKFDLEKSDNITV